MAKETENLNSQNEELENDNSENVEESTDENTEESENESEDTSDESNEESNEESQDEYTEREKQLYARLKKAEGFVQDENGKWVKPTKKPVKKTEKKSDAPDEVTLSRLEVRGVMEQEDQDYVLRFAKNEGISPIEALNDDIVKDRLAANKRRRESDKATPRSNNRANNQVDEVDAYVRKYKRAEAEGKDPGSVLPDNNPALTSKILSKLSKGA